MKKISIVFLFFSITLLLISCNSREDVNHISQEEMINYVKDAIDEEIALVSVKGKEQDSVMNYVFKLVNRNLNFTAVSTINALHIDGSRFGNYERSVYINYEAAIAESESYREKRSQISKDLNINEERLGFIYIHNYEDIGKVAQYAVELDKIYGFNEKKPERIRHIKLGSIEFSDTESAIAGPNFSYKKKNRLIYKDVYNELVSSYIKQLKQFNLKDHTIPDNVWKETE